MAANDVQEVKNLAATHDQTMWWAHQSITFAFMLRENEAKQFTHSEKYVEQATKEARATANELWNATKKDLGSTLTPSRAIMDFASRVLDWCEQHRRQ